MDVFSSRPPLKFIVRQMRERLWIRPLIVCLVSIAVVLSARLADGTGLADLAPEIAKETVDALLTILSSGMLVIATFSVGAMVSAYVSASNTATPRSFSLVVADDVSQNALSTFVGAFIFSVVSITALETAYYDKAGLFIVFVMTLLVFALVIFTFVRWVDRIARLGLLGSTIEKVENATADALRRRYQYPRLGGVPLSSGQRDRPVYAAQVGYVQGIDMESLQQCAQEHNVRIEVAALPGTFATPTRELAFIVGDKAIDPQLIINTFSIGDKRMFDEDPRFGLVVLSEIASRALSQGINDPGTAIGIISSFVRLFVTWCEPEVRDNEYGDVHPEQPCYDRIEVPDLSIRDMFDDAFTGIARDGADKVEVVIRLQKAFLALSALDNEDIRSAASHHASLALARARLAMDLPEDVKLVEDLALSLADS